MTFENWIKDIVKSGNLCDAYTGKVNKAYSNKQLVDLALDANGATYLIEMREKNMPLPYETIINKFGSFINGRYKAEFISRHGTYTSSIYCCYEGDVYIDTTLTTMLGCRCKVILEDYSVNRIYCDTNTHIDVECPDNTKCYIECWGNATVNLKGNRNNTTIINHE